MSLGGALRFVAGIDLRPAEREIARFTGAVQGALGTVGRAGALIGGTLAAGLSAGALAIRAVTSAGSEMENFAMQLTTIMQSSSGASARLEELFEIAATTKFNTEQVVAADVALRGFGADAERMLPLLIDFSSALGTDLTQSAVDFGKAWSQGGVGLESDTGKILKSMIEAEAGVRTADMTIEQFRENMAKTVETRFMGGAERAANTFSGLVSNLEDQWSAFARKVGEAGLFENVKESLRSALTLIEENQEGIGDLAVAVSSGLWTGVRTVALGVASIVDSLEVWPRAIALAVANLVDFLATTVEVTAGIREAVSAWLTMVDHPLADDAQKTAVWFKAQAAEQRVLAASAHEFADSIDTGADRSEAMAEALAGIEERAKAAKTAFEGVAKIGGVQGGAEKETADEKRARELLEKRFDEASAFQAEIAALDDTAAQREQALYDERLATLEQFYRESLITGQAYTDAVLAVDADRASTVSARLAEEAAQRREVAEHVAEHQRDMAQQEAEALEAQREARAVYGDAVLEGTSSLLGQLGSMMDQENAKQKAAYKAFAITQVGISTAQAMAKAMAQFGFPAGLGPAALAFGFGASQIAAIAKAHQGASPEVARVAHQGAGPDERDVRMLRTESVLNSQASRDLGPQGVNALNAGASARPIVNVIRVGRGERRELMRDELRENGAVRETIKSYVSSGELDAGFTGAGAFA